MIKAKPTAQAVPVTPEPAKKIRPKTDILKEVERIYDRPTFYMVVERLMKRAKDNPDPRAPSAVFIGDCFKQLSLKANQFIVDVSPGQAVFRPEAMDIAAEFRGMRSRIDNFNMLHVEKGNQHFQMFLYS